MNRPVRVLAFTALLVIVIVFIIESVFSARSSAGGRQAPGPCPPGIPAINKDKVITAIDVTDYVQNHPLPRNMNAKAQIDPKTVKVQSTDLGTVRGYLGEGDNGCSKSTQVIYVEFQAVNIPNAQPADARYTFDFPGPGHIRAHYPVGFEVFLVQGGSLLEAGGKSTPSLH